MSVASPWEVHIVDLLTVLRLFSAKSSLRDAQEKGGLTFLQTDRHGACVLTNEMCAMKDENNIWERCSPGVTVAGI